MELPKIVDDEGDDIIFEGCPEYTFIEFTIKEENTPLMKIDKMKIDEDMNVECEVTLSDDSMNSRTVAIEINIKMNNAMPSSGDMEFDIDLLSCQPLARLLSYEYVCNKDKNQKTCEFFGKGAAYIVDHKDKDEASFDVKAEIEKFNKEVKERSFELMAQVKVAVSKEEMKKRMASYKKEFGKIITPLEFR